MDEIDIENCIKIFERGIELVRSGEIVGVVISYQNKAGQSRVICSEGDIEIPNNMSEECKLMADKILNKIN